MHILKTLDNKIINLEKAHIISMKRYSFYIDDIYQFKCGESEVIKKLLEDNGILGLGQDNISNFYKKFLNDLLITIYYQDNTDMMMVLNKTIENFVKLN